VAALLVFERPMHGHIEQPTDRDFANALNMASGSETLRARFHAPYIVPVKDAVIEQLEVITEYRRLVLAAEEQLKAGNWMLGRGGFDQKGRTLKDLLKPFAGQVSIRARLRFHPHNSYVTLPPFDVLLGEPTLVAQQSIRTPQVIPASGDGNPRDFIAGATIEITFDALEIADRALPVRIVSEGKELARAVVDFARFD
jgi:hypothetical protein